MSDLLRLSAVELARLVRTREVSPVELCEVHIARTEAVNPHLNALVAERFEAAREEARAAETAVLAAADPDELPVLHGVPCTIKEFFAVEGMPWTGGIEHRRGTRATTDATCVTRLRAAGAVILGVSNVPEGGLWLETYNNIYGRTANPSDVRHTPGGSSGGEGALVAAGASPFGLGSDVGGSIRIPAFMCGVVGHKPTGRMVPNTGQHPGATGEGNAYLCSGPMGRTVADMMPLLRVLAGPDGRDPVTRSWPLGDPDEVDLSEVVVYPMASNGRTLVGHDIREALREAAAALEARGATLREPDLPRMRHAMEIWSASLALDNDESYDQILGKDGELPLLRELLRWPLGRSSHSFPALALTVGDRLLRPWQSRLPRWRELGRSLRAELDGLLGSRGVLLYPPYSRPAPRHNAPWLTPIDFACTGIFNILESPATAVPAGRSPRGLPRGVQVVGARGQDHLCLAVAQALEDHFGRWEPVSPRRAGRELLPAAAGADSTASAAHS